MRLCLLIDALGVATDLREAAFQSWGLPRHGARGSSGPEVSWLVRDSRVAEPVGHPGFVVENGTELWVHQPLVREPPGGVESFHDLSSHWPPPHLWASDHKVESLIWHVQRRWRLLTAPPVLKRLRVKDSDDEADAPRGCDWLGLFRANSFVDVEALRAVLRHHVAATSAGSHDSPRIFGRLMIADTQGLSNPVVQWGDSNLHGSWSNTGLLLNRAAVKLLAQAAEGHEETGTLRHFYIEKLALWLLSIPELDEMLAIQGDVDMGHVSCIDLLFAACLRSQHRGLIIQALPHQRMHFLVGDLLLRRFLYRLGSASFAWSHVDRVALGLAPARRASRRTDQGMLPHCLLSFFPVTSPRLQFLLQRLAPRVACLPSRSLPNASHKPWLRVRARGGLSRMLVAAKDGEPLVLLGGESGRRPVPASRSPQWRALLRWNRLLWASMVDGPQALGAGSRTFRLSKAAGEAMGLALEPPELLHGDEWGRGPAGQLRLRTPVTIVLSFPNSGTTWFLSMMQTAQQSHVGCAAISSDVMHPHCNAMLAPEISKIMGAPEDSSWPHIFRTSSPAAFDLLMELAVDQMHVKAIRELRYMRTLGRTMIGERLPESLIWPWKGVVDAARDPSRIRLLLSKEIINVFQLTHHVQYRRASGAAAPASFLGLYRHRAHTFPMSNESALLCKECMLTRMVQSLEVNHFPRDAPMAGLRRWWLRRARHIGGAHGPCGLVFAHLLVWYSVLRAGITTLDYARLMMLERVPLEAYLNASLPRTLRRSPGVAAIAWSIQANRFERPLDFLQRRERKYAALGVEGFAQRAIREMRRLDPHVDLSLLEQMPHHYSAQ